MGRETDGARVNDVNFLTEDAIVTSFLWLRDQRNGEFKSTAAVWKLMDGSE